MEKRTNETRAEIRFIAETYAKLVCQEESGEAARYRHLIRTRDNTPLGFLRGYLASIPMRHIWGQINADEAVLLIHNLIAAEKERVECANLL